MSGLRRLGPVAAMVLVAGNMIGSGIFMLPATLGTIGSVSLIAWGLASLGALLVALVFSFLAQIRPQADGVVAYAAEGLHPAAGHVSWFAYWLNCWIGTVAVAVAATGYLAYFFPVLKAPGVSTFTTLGVIWGLTLINLVGPRVMARYGAATLILGLAPIALATVAGALAFDPEIFAASWNVSGKPDSVVITASVAPIFWAFLGLESAVVAAAVIENPKRNLPIATVGGVLLAAVVYMAASAAIMGLAPASVMAASTAPFADAIKGFAGPVAASLVAFCALAKASGTVGGWVLVTAETSRSGAAAGYLPKMASEVNPDRKPTRDILVAAALMSVATIASASPTLGAQFTILINVAVILSMILYLLCALALLRMSGEIEGPRRYAAIAAAVLGGGFCAWVIATSDHALRTPTLVIVGLSLALWAAARFTQRSRTA